MSYNDTLASLETPVIVVDAARLARNIERVAAIGHRNGVAVRPHIKTHKSIAIARQQIAAGACGITASKASEAEVFIEAGVKSVTLAYPLIDERKARRLIARARERGCTLALVADSTAVLDCLEVAAQEAAAPLAIFLKVDVGLHRIGYQVNDPALPAAAQRLDSSTRLAFGGLLSHAGHAYGAAGGDALRAIAESERQQMREARDILQHGGVEVAEISVGSTPTVLAGESFEGITEIRPGNYVYLDLTAIRLGVARFEDISFSVLTSVISVNDRYAIIDAGSKVLSSDLGPHGTTGVTGFGLAFPLDREICTAANEQAFSVSKLSEEHGFIEHTTQRLAIGDRLRVVPNHSCPVANLARQMAFVTENGALQQAPIDAAGRVQ